MDRGPTKKRILNAFAIWIAAAATLSAGFTGRLIVYEEGYGVIWGWIVSFLIAAFVFGGAMRWLEKDRYFRP